MKAVVASFNQEKALVGAFSVIVKTDCETDGSFYSTNNYLDAHFNVHSTYLIRHKLRLFIYILALMLPFLARRYLTEVSVGKSKSENYQMY